jgi:hypothetical protein
MGKGKKESYHLDMSGDITTGSVRARKTGKLVERYIEAATAQFGDSNIPHQVNLSQEEHDAIEKQGKLGIRSKAINKAAKGLKGKGTTPISEVGTGGKDYGQGSSFAQIHVKSSAADVKDAHEDFMDTSYGQSHADDWGVDYNPGAGDIPTPTPINPGTKPPAVDPVKPAPGGGNAITPEVPTKPVGDIPIGGDKPKKEVGFKDETPISSPDKKATNGKGVVSGPLKVVIEKAGKESDSSIKINEAVKRLQ